jgi:glycosyltransferase involved in cell wall biosynthesis
MLNYEFPPIGGGASQAHLNLLRKYSDIKDLQVDVLTSAPEPGFFTERFSDNITIFKVGIHKKDLHFWRRDEVIEWLLKAGVHYRRLLGENDYDLAHAFFGFPTGWLCYRNTGKLPYIISLRGSDVPGKHVRLKLDYKILGPVFKKIWKKAAALVACSQGLKSRALQFLPTVQIEVIPNGVELDKFYPAQSSKKTDVLRLITIGRLSVTKRVPMLIDAVSILHKEGFKLKLTIAGGGQMENQLKQIVSERNLSSIIDITGRISAEDMPMLYRKNDIFISASMLEGMSNAMLEAMASGLPIISTRCEGLDELIADNGIVVEQPDAASIADAIKTIADDEKKYAAMQTAARKHAEKFSWKKAANQYIKIYHNIIGE